MLIEWFKKVRKRFQLLVHMNDVLIDNNEALQNATNEAEAYYKQREVNVSRREGELDKREAQLESALTRESVVNNTYQAVQDLTPVIMGKIDMVAQQLQHITILPVKTVYGRSANFLGIFVIALLVLLGGAITTAFVYRDANKTLRQATIDSGDKNKLVTQQRLKIRFLEAQVTNLHKDILDKIDPKPIIESLAQLTATVRNNGSGSADQRAMDAVLERLSKLTATLVAMQKSSPKDTSDSVSNKTTRSTGNENEQAEAERRRKFLMGLQDPNH